MSYLRSQLNSWLSKIDISDKVVLDVGAGKKKKWASNFVKGSLGMPLEYMTLDIDKDFNPDITADLNKPISFSKEYNIVFCLETLEHCWNPVQAVRNLYNFSRPDGVCYISTPFINPHHDKWDYLRFTGEWFEKVLKEVGFSEIVVEERIATKGKDSLEEFYKLEGLRVSKIRPEYGQYTYPIGYCVKAVK